MLSNQEAAVSPVLFLSVSGNPLRFYLRPGPSKVQLQSHIKAGGGVLCRSQEPHAVLLADREDISSVGDSAAHWYVSTQYIRDCVERNQQLEMEDYRFTPQHVQTRSSKQRPPPAGRFTGRLPYTPEEDAAILKIISKSRSKVGGNQLWQEMEKKHVTNHSWQSMKDRYIKHLVGRLVVEQQVAPEDPLPAQPESQLDTPPQKRPPRVEESPSLSPAFEMTRQSTKSPAQDAESPSEAQNAESPSEAHNAESPSDAVSQKAEGEQPSPKRARLEEEPATTSVEAVASLVQQVAVQDREQTHRKLGILEKASREFDDSEESDEETFHPCLTSTAALQEKGLEAQATSTAALQEKGLEAQATSTAAPQEKGLEAQATSTAAPQEKGLEAQATSTAAPQEKGLESQATSTAAPQEKGLEAQATSTAAPQEKGLEAQATSTAAPQEKGLEAQATSTAAPQEKGLESQASRDGPPVKAACPGAAASRDGPPVKAACPGAAASRALPPVKAACPGAAASRDLPPVKAACPGAAASRALPPVKAACPGAAASRDLPPVKAACPGAAASEPAPSHLFVFESDSQEEEPLRVANNDTAAASSPQPISSKDTAMSLTQAQLEEDKERIRALMKQTNLDLLTVTKALLNSSGDFLVALRLLQAPCRLLFWSCHDDGLLLSSDPAERRQLEERHGQEGVAKRLAFLDLV